MAFRAGPPAGRRRAARAWSPGWRPRAFLLTTYQFVRDAMLGNSEALLAALALWAFERHLDGRRDHALYLGFAAALLRPGGVAVPRRLRPVAAGSASPSCGCGSSRRRRCWSRCCGSARSCGARASRCGPSSRANNPNPGSAAFADTPASRCVKRFHERTVVPLEALALPRPRCWRRVAVAPPTARRARCSPCSASACAWIGAGGVHDRARLRGQPALPDRHHRGHLRAGRRRCGPRCFEGAERAGRAAGVARSAGWARPASAVALSWALVALAPVIGDKADNVRRDARRSCATRPACGTTCRT